MVNITGPTEKTRANPNKNPENMASVIFVNWQGAVKDDCQNKFGPIALFIFLNLLRN